jgi:1-acyl-sn-glycerol-3-phosphate acyltransferase
LRTAYFTENTYDTPENHPRAWADRLLINSRGYFLYKYAGVVIRARRKALDKIYDTEAWAHSSIEIFKILENCGGRFHLSGLNNIDPQNGPYVFVSNHMSALETQIFPCIIASKLDVTFVVKSSLISYPFFGPILRATKPIVVSRENSRIDLMRVLSKGERLLSEGISVVIFPQSTRRLYLVPKEFNSLGVKLASKAKVKVLPVAIKTNFWGNGKIVKDLGPLNRNNPIYMEFGKPFEIKGKGKEENDQIIAFIQDRLKKWSD